MARYFMGGICLAWLERMMITPSKLICSAEQGSGEIRVTEADYRFDLSDLRPELLEMFRECGVCMSDLEDKLVQEAIVYGEDG